jgi:hypothetical protein
VSLGLLFALALSSCGILGTPRLTTDKDMRDYFVAHQSDFQVLADTVREDKQASAIIKWDSPTSFKFRDLMARVGARYVFRGGGDGGLSVAITTERWGDESRNIVLGFIWMTRTPPASEVVTSIDPLMTSSSTSSSGGVSRSYSFLSDHWYIVYQR